jgi:hypothetical protein
MKSGFSISILLFGLALLLSSALFITNDPKDEFLEDRAELVVRQIGHNLLLQSGDLTSRVLPVKQLSPGVYQLEFQNNFSFVPDTLVNIVRSNLAQINLPVGYIVNVFDCASNGVVYGFEISPGYREIVPCLGRAQPMGCYSIQISFIDFQSSQNISRFYPLMLVALFSLSLVAYFGRRIYLKKEKEEDPITVIDGIPIGTYSFSLSNQLLRSDLETIELSDKEAKLLSIFAAKQNQLISREELLKKVWEDDGVFTGRSLDMFISKLRKKFKNDPSVQITNVHGKGYKLEIKHEG